MRRILFTVWLVEKIQPLWQHSWLWCVLREKLLLCFVFFETRFLCSPDCPRINFVDQSGLEFRDLPALPPEF